MDRALEVQTSPSSDPTDTRSSPLPKSPLDLHISTSVPSFFLPTTRSPLPPGIHRASVQGWPCEEGPETKPTWLLLSHGTGEGREGHVYSQPPAKGQGTSARILREVHCRGLKASSEGSQVRGQARAQTGLLSEPELATDLTVPAAWQIHNPTFRSPRKGPYHLDLLFFSSLFI